MAQRTDESTLDALFEALDEGVLIFDEAQRCRAVGRRVGELFGLDPRSLIGETRASLVERFATVAADPDAVRALAAEGDSGGRTVADPIEIARTKHTLVWTSVPIPGASGPAGRIDILRDVTRERRAEEAQEDLQKRLDLVSTLDDLTGLVNRKRFEEECQREHRRAQREWISYAVARIDIDGMTKINDTRGREIGDDVLRKVGEGLRAARREYDVVARWVADEFVVLLPRADGPAARKVMRRALDDVYEKARTVAPGMTASVGVAIWAPPSSDGPADTLRRAGDALAGARAKGVGSMEVDMAFGAWKDEPSDG